MSIADIQKHFEKKSPWPVIPDDVDDFNADKFGEDASHIVQEDESDDAE